MMMEITDTEPAVLGTLPEGIGLGVGSSAPELVGTDHTGARVELRSLWESGDVLLVFYRGGWCPFCNFQIHELTEAYPQFQERGITLVAVSVDRMEEAARTQSAHEIPFPVLSDPDLTWHEAFRVLNPLEDEYVEMLTGYEIDIEAHSGKTHHTVAVPALFLIGKNGAIRWGHAAHDYKVRPRTASLLAALDRLPPG
jgi:peroxiredoxin